MVKNIILTKVWQWECNLCGSKGYEPTFTEVVDRAKLHNECNHSRKVKK